MSALEQEIYEKFQQLDDAGKQRVLTHLNAAAPATTSVTGRFAWREWFEGIETLRERLRAEHGGVFPDIDVVGMLRQIREDED